MHRRATVRDAGLKIFSVLGLTAVLAGTYAAVTLRGDLARMTGAAVACGLLVLFVSRAIERHQRCASSPSRVARTLVGPLREAGHPDLARDLVAATEILAALREGEVKGSRALAKTFLEQVQANLGARWEPLARLLAPARPPRSRGLALATVALVLVAAAFFARPAAGEERTMSRRRGDG